MCCDYLLQHFFGHFMQSNVFIRNFRICNVSFLCFMLGLLQRVNNQLTFLVYGWFGMKNRTLKTSMIRTIKRRHSAPRSLSLPLQLKTNMSILRGVRGTYYITVPATASLANKSSWNTCECLHGFPYIFDSNCGYFDFFQTFIEFQFYWVCKELEI